MRVYHTVAATYKVWVEHCSAELNLSFSQVATRNKSVFNDVCSRRTDLIAVSALHVLTKSPCIALPLLGQRKAHGCTSNNLLNLTEIKAG